MKPAQDAGDEPVLLPDDVGEILDSSGAGTATMRGGAIRTLGYFLSALLGLISAPLLVRHLGIADFGRYLTVISLVALAAGVTDAGLTSVAIREWTTRDPEERADLMRHLLGLRIVLTLAGMAGAVTFGFAAGYSSTLIVGTCLAGFGMLLQVLQSAYSVPLQTDLRLGLVTLADLLRQIVSVALIVAGVVAGAKLLVFLAVPIPASLVPLVFTIVFVVRRLPLSPAFGLRRWRFLIHETLPVAGAVALHHVYLRIVIVLMSLIATAVETGYFATSYRITEVLMQVPFLLAQSTLPLMSRAAHTDAARLRASLRRMFEASTILGLGVMLVVIAGAPFMIQVLAGHAGKPAVPVLRLQAIAVCFVFLTVTWQNALFAVRRQGSLVLSNAIGIAVTAAFTLALVPPLAARGAAIAAAIGELALTVASVVLLLRSGRGISLSLGFLPRVLLAAAVGGAAFLIPGLPSAARMVVIAVVYGGALLAVGAVPRELIDAVVPARFARS